MGNRAVITTEENYENNGVGVYLHWNGGYDSVRGFLAYCKIKGFRTPETDCYGWARLCQIIGNFFGGELSLGVGAIHKDIDDGSWCDNGTYIIKDWEVVDRKHFDGVEQDEYEFVEFLHDIDIRQPEHCRLTEEEKQKANELFGIVL